MILHYSKRKQPVSRELRIIMDDRCCSSALFRYSAATNALVSYLSLTGSVTLYNSLCFAPTGRTSVYVSVRQCTSPDLRQCTSPDRT